MSTTLVFMTILVIVYRIVTAGSHFHESYDWNHSCFSVWFIHFVMSFVGNL